MNGYMQAATPLNLATALHGHVRRLHHVMRFSSIPCLKPESVATHSWQVAMICLVIGTEINTRDGEDTVNMEYLLERALVHDLNEAVSGDIIRSYKYGHPAVREAMKDADERNTYLLTREFGSAVGDALMVAWGQSKDDTLEGEIVGFADIMAVVTYVAEEHRMGNTELDIIAQHAYHNLLVPQYLGDDDTPSTSPNQQFFEEYVWHMYPRGDWKDIFNSHRKSNDPQEQEG